ncbi:hypothetical protein [Paraburkholderia caribensis]|uniref:hypothetical protein n=1 Tax=Paraburkholderia caribensis TaxID=75105 RepID=UPI00072270DC|nr:hypothetical protein [Paraburkholderia caribensis]ALP67215.1 hypothetical protein AN416_31500 [Paraburkholderia caribensis]CAG9189858.1 conserved exported hypothetical protein [Paraburkholderia caribensis]
MRLSGRRAVIAMSISLSVVLCAHAFAQTAQRDGLLNVNAADDRIEARHREAARAEQRRLDAHREEAHREDAHLEQERLAEARREARIDAYHAWLAHWHDMRSRDGMTP